MVGFEPHPAGFQRRGFWDTGLCSWLAFGLTAIRREVAARAPCGRLPNVSWIKSTVSEKSARFPSHRVIVWNVFAVTEKVNTASG
jgi:hypothetical protein